MVQPTTGRTMPPPLAGEDQPGVDAPLPRPVSSGVDESGRDVEKASRAFLRAFSENRLALLGVVVVAIIVLFSWVGPLLYHTSQTTGDLEAVNLAPGGGHLLGTDDNGFDILGRLMIGGRVSIEVGVAVAVIATSFGTCVGAIAGFFVQVGDTVIMRLVDVGLAIPPVFIFIFLSLVFKPTVGLLILILGGLSWLVPARLV